MTSPQLTDPTVASERPTRSAPDAEPREAARLPSAVERWLDRVDVPTRASRTAVIEGTARFRRNGTGWWLPMETLMWHDLGRHHIVDRRIGMGPLTFVRRLDGYVDETGFSRVRRTLDVGREVNQAALLLMWSEALLLPAAWRNREDVVWAGRDDDSVEVSFTTPAAPVTALLFFDKGTGLPVRLSAERHKGPSSRMVGWRVEYRDWRPTSDGVLLPGLVTAAWADEPGPWFRMKIERANPDADVGAAIGRGRSLLAQAAADPTGVGSRP